MAFIHAFESFGNSEWKDKVRELSVKTMDFSTLIKKLVDESCLIITQGQTLGKFTYHNSCYLKRTLNVYAYIRNRGS